MYTYKLILDNLNEKNFLLFRDDKVEHVSNLQPYCRVTIWGPSPKGMKFWSNEPKIMNL